MQRHTTLLLLGLLNLIHGLSHIIQLIQSVFLASYAFRGHEDGWFHRLMENPIMGVFWSIMGLGTIILGIKDYRHHKHHKD